jgi:PPP family 3-phenylpropionic acid transporter
MSTAVRLRLLFAAQGVALGSLLPYVVPLLSDRGLDPVAIGAVLGAGAVLSLLSYPLWGFLADGPVGRERSVLVTSLMGAAAGVAMLAADGDQPLLGVAVAAVSLGVAPWVPITDAIALQALGEGARAYGRIRLWASAGWAVAALAAGFLYVWLGASIVVVAFIAASLGVAALAWSPRPSDPTHPGVVAEPIRALRRWRRRRPASGADGPGLAAIIRASPVVVPFLVAVFLEALGSTAGGSFVSLRILDIGGGPVLIGIAAALPAIIEIPFFSGSSVLAARLGLRWVFVIGTGVAALQWVVIALVPDPSVTAVARSIDGAAYALRYAAVVLVIGACLPARYRATGQSLVWIVGGGLAAIVAGPIAGAVYAWAGSTALLLGCAAALAAGCAIGWRTLRGDAFAPHPPTSRTELAPAEAVGSSAEATPPEAVAAGDLPERA